MAERAGFESVVSLLLPRAWTRAGWEMNGWRPMSIDRALRYGSFLRGGTKSSRLVRRVLNLLRILVKRPERS
jgi:hypothetical protein